MPVLPQKSLQRPPPGLAVEIAGVPAHLLPSGAAWLPEDGTLLVADAHIGKAQSFRRLGVPVPETTTAATLAALDADIAATGAAHLVFLGDFLHAARSRTPTVLRALDAWRAGHAALRMTLVRGNHDARAGDPPPQLAVQVADEPLRLGPLALCHHPEPVAGAYVLAGHWHPCITLHGRAFERLRLPCFWLGDGARAPAHAVGVLPAFGSFTGMHPVARRPGDRIYVVADQTVRALPVR